MDGFEVGDIVVGLPSANYYTITRAGSISRVVAPIVAHPPWKSNLVDIQLLLSPKFTNRHGSIFTVERNKFRKLTEAELVLWSMRIPDLVK